MKDVALRNVICKFAVMKAWCGVLGLGVLAATRALAGPEQEVAGALADLRQQENYAWTRVCEDTSQRIPDPSGSRAPQDRPAASWEASGRTENGGLTEWRIKPDKYTGRTVMGVNHGDLRIVNCGEGWVTLEELDRQHRVEAQKRMVALRAGEAAGSPDELLFKSGAFFAARVGHLTPVVVLEAIEGELRNISRVGSAIWANLSDNGAQRVLDLVKDSNSASDYGIRASDASGIVKFWVRDGHLAKLEVQIEGRTAPATTSRKLPETELKQIYTFTFDQFGTSDPRVPREALEKLASKDN